MVVIAAAGLILGGCVGPGTPASTPGPAASVNPTAIGPATATPSPASTAASTPVPTYELTTFSSPLYGYSFAYPAVLVARPATTLWPLGAYLEPEHDYVDALRPRGTVLAGLAGMAAQPIPDGMSADEWLQHVADRRHADGVACRFPLDAWTDATVAGVPARRIEAACRVEYGAPFDGIVLDAAWVIDGTGYQATGTPVFVEIMLASFVAP